MPCSWGVSLSWNASRRRRRLMRLHKTTELRVSGPSIALEIDQTVERMLADLQAAHQQPLRLISVTHTPLASSYGVTENVLVTVIAEVDTSELARQRPRIEYKSGEGST